MLYEVITDMPGRKAMNKTGKRHFFAAIGAAAITGLMGSTASAGGLLDVEFEDADFAGFLATFFIRNNFV